MPDDLFGEWLKAVIHQKQGRRKEVLAAIQPLKEELEGLEQELLILQQERDKRSREAEEVKVPDYPPTPDGGDGVEEAIKAREAQQREAEQEAIDHHVGIDLSKPVKTKEYRLATLIAVRDWFYHNRNEWVKRSRISEETGIPGNIVTRRCQDLLDNGTLKHQGNRASSKFKFNKEMPDGPKSVPAASPRSAAMAPAGSQSRSRARSKADRVSQAATAKSQKRDAA